MDVWPEKIVPKRVIVHAYPNARKTQVRAIIENELHLDVAAPPENGKANAAIEKFLTKTTGRQARILSGRTSKKKIFVFAKE